MPRYGAFDDSNHHRQLESARSRAARIEEQHAVNNLVARLMAVAKHDDVRGFLQQLRLKDVREKKPPAGDR